MKTKTSASLGKYASWKNFLCSKGYFIGAAVIISLLAWSFLAALKVRAEVTLVLLFFWLGFLLFVLVFEYYERRKFYRELLGKIEQLDQAYLVLETLSEPKFYDGEILYQALYRINKSMVENINKYRMRSQEFQEYVEMWIHEVKTPLATLSLISRDTKVNEQIRQLNDYVEQVLYFVRAENAEQDYLIKTTNLREIINRVAGRNREILQAKRINLAVTDVDIEVQTDAKWLEFILNQIMNNSIKYQSHEIKITTKKLTGKVVLEIADDGIGILEKDLPRVFEKSFTGTNGRLGKQSTGMGLYIAKTLCEKLGYKISIASERDNYTKVTLEFVLSEYRDVVQAKLTKM